jgi:hypothetical protein
MLFELSVTDSNLPNSGKGRTNRYVHRLIVAGELLRRVFDGARH